VEQLTGTIKSIRYTNEKTGYTVCEMKCDHSVITMVGIMPLLAVGENVTAKGSFVHHPDYGRQFKAEECERRTPTRLEEIQLYLSSGFIKGLGPATAQKIVETFGEKTFQILQFEPYQLAEIKGITPEKALSFAQGFLEHENMRGVVMLMQRFGVPASFAAKIWKKFDQHAEQEIRQNPYRLSEGDIGLSFSICDRIALSLGIEPFCKDRLKSALFYLLSSSVSNGNTYVLKENLIKRGVRLTKVSEELILDAFDSLLLEGRIFIEKQHPERVYTDTLIEAERFCAFQLNRLNRRFENHFFSDSETLLSRYESAQRIDLDEIQKKAVKCALEHGITIITGGPGTGKTTIIKTLIQLFERQDLSVILAAPTGRAAKRISETSGCEAKTIHRLLEVGYNIDEEEKPYFLKNEDNPLSADVIIVDEASMIDIMMMSSLLKAIPEEARLVLVGDSDQLPSVGPGRVLADIIESGQFPVVKLETIFRQKEESLIITNAHLINQGIMPAINEEESDFYFIQKLRSTDVAESIVDLCTRRIPEGFGLDSIRDIQVLSPMRKGETGIYHLNGLLQESLNPAAPDKPQKVHGNVIFRTGDRVMQIRNDYSLPWTLTDEKGKWSEGLGVYNGDMGVIIDIDQKVELLTVCFDDSRTCEYRFDQLDNLEHAYAITVHKSQGTEFPAVVIPLFAVPPALVCRNILYTAVTRAKRLVVLVGSPAAMEEMVKNINEKERYSGLKERLV